VDQLNDLKDKIVSTIKSKVGKAEEFIDDEITEHA